MKRFVIASCLVFVAACTESAAQPLGDIGGGEGGGSILVEAGKVIDVAVPEAGRVYVKLAAPGVVTPTDLATSTDWDLAFEGADVFTNGGPSGPGRGGAFGPLEPPFDPATPPEVPFVQQDKTGGAFLDWYAYDGTTHALYSRYHVVGVRSRGKDYKVQILGYYGEQVGSPVSGIYQARYAEVTSSGVGETRALADVDATAGGLSAPEDAPSGCVDLASGERVTLTPDEAAASSSWDLCFRRENISVNGELSGPRGDGAVDLQAADTAGEQLDAIMALDADGELARFDGVTYATMSDPKVVYRGDHVVTIFGSDWLTAGASPLTPAAVGWYVFGADGAASYLVIFESFDGATATSPGTIHLRVVPYAT